MENRRMQLKQHLTHSLTHLACSCTATSQHLFDQSEFSERKKKIKSRLKHAPDWQRESRATLFLKSLEKGVVTTCAADANLCLPYQHVRPKGRLIIHKVSGWPRQVNHSSACVFVTIEMEIDAPQTFRFIYADSAHGGTVGDGFQQYQVMVVNVSCDTIVC